MCFLEQLHREILCNKSLFVARFGPSDIWKGSDRSMYARTTLRRSHTYMHTTNKRKGEIKRKRKSCDVVDNNDKTFHPGDNKGRYNTQKSHERRNFANEKYHHKHWNDLRFKPIVLGSAEQTISRQLTPRSPAP